MFEVGTIYVIKTKHQFGESVRFVKVTRTTRGRTYVAPVNYNPYKKISPTHFEVTPSAKTLDVEYRVDRDCSGFYIGNDGRMKKSYLSERFNQSKKYVNIWN